MKITKQFVIILIISDGVFSKGKSLISNNEIKSSYNNSVAIRGNISKNKLHNLNENNISLFMGRNFHYRDLSSK